MNHLDESVRSLLQLPKAERIAKIRSLRWIGYNRAKTILARMEELFEQPRVPRMPGLLLVGGTNNGKTTLLNRFCAKHPNVNDPAAESAHHPVLMIQCPPGPNENRFYHALLDTLNVPYKVTTRPEVKYYQLKTVLGRVGTRMLLLDEIHHSLSGSNFQQKHFLNVLKFLSNDLQLPIVAAGTSEALNVVSTDHQIANRLMPMTLPRWTDDKEFWSLLASFETLLPLAKPSNLKGELLSSEIMNLSEGLLGEAATLLTAAACVAVNTKVERITLKIIRSLKFVPPSKRRGLKDSGDEDGGVVEFHDETTNEPKPGSQTGKEDQDEESDEEDDEEEPPAAQAA